MKYGESSFDVIYLLLAIICGFIMIFKSRGKTGKKMGIAALILGAGDAFHLVPRVINYFSSADMTAALGVGKFVTSLTMTVFYVFIYYIWLEIYGENENKKITLAVWILTALRVALCLFPQNAWIENKSDMLWGIIRNVPFVALGAIVIVLFFLKRNEIKRFKAVWLYVLLSFLFYIPVAVGAGAVPMLGMLMLPKTICYIILIITFLLYVLKDGEEKPSTT